MASGASRVDGVLREFSRKSFGSFLLLSSFLNCPALGAVGGSGGGTENHVEHPLAALRGAGAVGVRSRCEDRAHAEHTAAMILRFQRDAHRRFANVC